MENRKKEWEGRELSEEELDQVSGGMDDDEPTDVDTEDGDPTVRNTAHP